MAITEYGPISWERMIGAAEKVQRRLELSASALAGLNVPYSVIGGNAVAAWIATVDRAAVRGTPNVDLLIDRSNLGWAITAMQNAGFVQAFNHVSDVFLDSPSSRPNSRIRLFFAGERINERCKTPLPQSVDCVRLGNINVVSLHSLVEMKLAAFRIIDCVHLRDMLDVGLIDANWKSKLPTDLAARLQELIDDPDG